MTTPTLPKLSLALAAAVLAGACASGPSGPASESFGRVPAPGQEVLYPAPPDTTRVQFLVAISSEGDIRGEGGGGPSVLKPYGVEAGNGRIFVCDLDLHGITIFDLRDQSFHRFVPGGRGALQAPVNCSVDPETGFLYVADGRRSDVVVFDSTLTYVDHIKMELGRPGDVFVDGDTLWVSDMERGVVDVYEKSSRRWVRSIRGGERGTEGALTQPANIWVRGDRLYVSDFGSFRIKIYDRAGNHLQTVGSYGRKIGQFLRPKGVGVDAEGRIYVADAAIATVQLFNPQGELLLFFGGPYGGLGGLWLPAGLTIVDDPVEVDRFRSYVIPGYELEYLILVANQFGPDKVSVYGFVTPAQGSTVGP